MAGRSPDAITLDDREFLDPVLGGPLMLELRERDRALWERVGQAIISGFTAGKAAERARTQP